MNRLMVLVMTGLFLAVAAVPRAQAEVGLRTGLSLDPDDFLIGLHFRSHPLAESFYFIPSVEAGFGDATMIAGNADFHFVLPVESNLAPYVGGGVTLNWIDYKGGSATDLGGSILGGILLTDQIFLEGKIGLGEVPDWKFMIGWHIHSKSK